MGILQSNQILAGARNPVQTQTYALAGITSAPTVSIVNGGGTASAISFSGGAVEISGKSYSLNGAVLDFHPLVSLLKKGQKYQVAVVPKYDEPVSKSAAAALNPPLNYYVYQQNGYSVAEFFIDPAVLTAVNAAGGIDQLTDVVFKGQPTQAQLNLFTQYSEALERLSDLRYVAKILKPTGFEFILAETYAMNNFDEADALASMTQDEFYRLKALTNFQQKALTFTKANAISKYETGAIMYKVAGAYGYTSQGNMDADTNRIAVNLNQATPFTSTASATHYRVFEYVYPSSISLSQQGEKPDTRNLLHKEQAISLGRINPIYLQNPLESAKVTNPSKSALTLYADPSLVLEVVADGTTGYPTSPVVKIDPLIG